MRQWIASITSFYLIVMALMTLLSLLLPSVEIRNLLRAVLGISLFPSLLLSVINLWLRRARLTLALLPLVIAWGIIYGPLLFQRQKPNNQVPSSAPRVTVLTFNLKAATKDLSRLSEIIRAANADVVGLQELTTTASDHFSATLSDLYPHRALYPQSDPHNGQGVLSKFPLSESEYWRYDQIPASLGHMRTEVDFGERHFILYNVHPFPPISFSQGIKLQSHSRELGAVLERLQQEPPHPIILVGDFNMTSLMDEYRVITAQFTDTFRESGRSGFGFTFPSTSIPVLRLDYIFHSTHFRGLDAYPLAESGPSDHLPVWAELVLLPSE